MSVDSYVRLSGVNQESSCAIVVHWLCTGLVVHCLCTSVNWQWNSCALVELCLCTSSALFTSHTSLYSRKGSVGPWVLFWALKKALKRANSLKKTLLRANPLFWVLKKVFKKVSLIKRALKKVLLWVINSKKCSCEWSTQKSAQKSILDFLCNAQKSELYCSQLTNIGGDIIPWLVS